MRRIQILFCIGMGVVAGLVLAQSESDFQGWMKQIAANNGKLKGALKGQDKATASASAKVLEDSFKSVEGFWASRNVADAKDFAMKARMAAANVNAAVAAGNWDKAGTEAGALGATCAGCHGAHRGKNADGTYMIK